MFIKNQHIQIDSSVNDSNHLQTLKRAAFNSMVNRLFNTLLNEENYWYKKSCLYSKYTAICNGYNSKLIDNIVNKTKKRKEKKSKTALNKIRNDEN